ncbi:hypothetical protein C8J57DRAFT_1493607 [Mycena rebaudengoi]|nr:hypothetical protein C8J57DRAFT_1493607 [Mycena rebaudengoi]
MKRLRFCRKAKLKPPNQSSSRNGSTFSDILWTSLCALKDSADAFPPLKSAVGGGGCVRAKHSKADARDIALRTQEIIDVIADAVPDGSKIPPAMLQSIERFTLMLEEIRVSMEAITLTGGVSRVVHLSENERTVRDIKARLDEQYRDFLAASALRVEVEQTAIAQRQTETQADVEKVSAIALRVEVQQTAIAQRQTETQADVQKVSAATDRLLLFSRSSTLPRLPHPPFAPMYSNERLPVCS